MSKETIKTASDDENTYRTERAPIKKLTAVNPFKRWPTAVAAVLLVAAAAGGIYALIQIAILFFAETTARATFITGNAVNLFVFLAIVAQAGIYLGQRHVMIHQWKAMTDQLEAVNKQEEHLLTQANAARDAADMAKGQLVAMQHQEQAQVSALEETRKLVVQNENMVKALQGQLDAIKGQETVMRDQLSAMKVQAAASEAQFETAGVGIKAAEKSSIYANRAYVTASIDGMSAFRVHLRIGNSGNSPANDVRVSYAYGLREKPPIEEAEDGQTVWDIGYTERERLGLIAAGSSIPIITPDLPQLTGEQHQRWKLSQIKFYCWGVICYEDMFNEKRTTWFCFYQSQGHPNGYPNEHGNQAI